ncbi:hypothetical protein CBR_g55221 [Chara braunii]|uniref:Uncharacterized protein n=1 Tax=Chara braunii TaxID=69332 RepID=A0A388MCQ2_CHABU|nr:hypothetical protein CBR_g55221 [Chara braunii]|eukprot:GBG92341.1 hypothetical protein CBR_g55221 [Chara braunii]
MYTTKPAAFDKGRGKATVFEKGKGKGTASGKEKEKVAQEELQVPRGLMPGELTDEMARAWDELQSLQLKKISQEPFYLPMTCLKRPPVDGTGNRSLEVREPDEDHVSTLMDSMIACPTGDHLPFVGVVDPDEVKDKSEVDLDRLRRGGYNIYVLGGGHCREARERPRQIYPDMDDYNRNVCYVYAGLSTDEARQMAHKHNLAARYYRDMNFIEKMKCWRNVFERKGSVKIADVKIACLREYGIPQLIASIVQLADDLSPDIYFQSDDIPAPYIFERSLDPCLQWTACLEEPRDEDTLPSRQEYLKPYEIIPHAFFSSAKEVVIDDDDDEETSEEGSYSEHSEGELSEGEEVEEETGSEWEALPEEATRMGTEAEDPEAA